MVGLPKLVLGYHFW